MPITDEEHHHLSEHSTKVKETYAGLITHLKLDNEAVVIEIAPGHSPKVGMGVHKALPSFRGTYIVIEPDKDAIDKIRQIYDTLFPSAEMVYLDTIMASALASLRPGLSPDLIVANHPLDDMIIGRDLQAGGKSFEQYFSHMYDTEGVDEADQIKMEAAAWFSLEYSRPADCLKYKHEVVVDWVSFVRALRPRHLVIAQYESRTLKQYKVEAPDRLAFDVLKNLASLLPCMSLGVADLLSERGFDPRRWIVSTWPFVEICEICEICEIV